MIEADLALVERATAWAAHDPDPETARELTLLIDAGNVPELRERFEPRLSFGTAGLRGVVGAGPARMNRAVVQRTTLAVAEHLLATVPDARTLPVVVGFDARHTSCAFAEVAIGVLVAAGIPVHFFDAPVPTPLVAYAVRALASTAGIVVTASHNPAEYNGYKLYGGDGIQVVSPADRDIEQRSDEGPLPDAIAVAPRDSPAWSALATPIAEALIERYFSDLDAARPRGPADRSLRIVYTPLHGVGGRFALEALRRAGFTNVIGVPEQMEPDGSFPTTRSPNPEDGGALELAFRTSTEHRAALVLANDPDADRLAVAVTTPAGRPVLLTGNEIGALLADFLLQTAPATPLPLVVTTVVSSPLIGQIASARGARVEITATGFKWIWTAARQLERDSGVRFVFGCEEAIGFSVSPAVRDKDGLSAAVVFAELVARCHAAGESVLERLRRLYVEHGLWASAVHTVECPGQSGARAIEEAIERLSRDPPSTIAGRPVTSVVDYRIGAEARPPWLPKMALLRLELGAHGRVLVRPSGTEPKLKIYADLADLKGDVTHATEVDAALETLRARARLAAAEVSAELGFDEPL